MRSRLSGKGFVLVAGCCLFWAVFGWPFLTHAYESDFLCYYIGGTIVRQGRFADLYHPAAQSQVQQIVAPAVKELRPYVRPPWFALCIAPLTFLPLVNAYIVWAGMMFAILIATWVWGFLRFGEFALVLAALFLPSNLGTFAAQDCALMLAIVCIFFASAERERLFVSGMALGVGLIKPHLLLLFPLWMLLQKRWRMLAGLALAVVALLATATLILGASGLSAYLHLLLHGQTELGYSRSSDRMLNIYSLPANFGISSRAVNAVLAAIVVGLAACRLRFAPVWQSLCLASTGSLLISPHAFEYDGGMLLLSIWLVMANSGSKSSRYSALVLAAPFTFFFTMTNRPFRCIPALALFVFFLALVRERPERFPSGMDVCPQPQHQSPIADSLHGT